MPVPRQILDSRKFCCSLSKDDSVEETSQHRLGQRSTAIDTCDKCEVLRLMVAVLKNDLYRSWGY